MSGSTTLVSSLNRTLHWTLRMLEEAVIFQKFHLWPCFLRFVHGNE